MTNWQERLFRDFVVGAHDILVVADPDRLLRNPASLNLLAGRGFQVLVYSDPIEFRYAYEISYRAVRDQRGDRGLIVAFEPDQHGFEVIPYDIIKDAKKIDVALKDVFPLLDYEVMRGIDSDSYNTLFNACQGRTSSLGRRETAEFVLQHAYGIVPSLVSDSVSLIRLVISMHYGRKALPAILHRELLSILSGCRELRQWPVNDLLTSASFLWGFLQERWKIFIEKTRGGLDLSVQEIEKPKYPGPIDIPFEHPDIRVFIDNLFQEEILTPIPWLWEDALPENWIKVGLSGNEQENLRLRFETLAERLSRSYPSENSSVNEWSLFAFAFHQLQNLFWQLDHHERSSVDGTRLQISIEANRIFDAWRRRQYSRLFNASPVEPTMVHHLPHFIANQLARNPEAKWAMIVVDGMSVGQWSILKDGLEMPSDHFFEETCVCACIPSITPVSRQSLHCGRLPIFFPETVDRTDRDASHWRAFWEERGIDNRLVLHSNYRGEESELDNLETLLELEPKLLAITVMKIDKIMHGMQLGAEGMWNQCVLWRNQGWLSAAISLIISRGFNVVVTSDHGNVEGCGIGSFSEGSLTENSGQRCRIYRNNSFAQDFAKKYAEHGELLDTPLLPSEYRVVAARYGNAFVQSGQRIVAHGGCSLEEVLVPFIRIYKKETEPE